MKLFRLGLIGLLLLAGSAFAQVEKTALEVLKAYKNRDVEGVKFHASGLFKMAISADFFKDKDIQAELKAVDKWSGKIQDIRYTSGNIMGQQVTTATVYYADDAGSKEKVHVLILSTTDRKTWVILGGGLETVSRQEFMSMAKSLDASKAAKSAAPFSLEVADGTNIAKASESDVEKALNKLDEDVFYLIVSRGDDFMQVAYSEKGMIVQYKENGQQKEAEPFFSKEDALKILLQYIRGDAGWKNTCNWVDAG